MAYSIITISREFGTGARLIGRQLAEMLGYDYYDRALIEMSAEKSGLSEEFIERTEEKASNSFLYNLCWRLLCRTSLWLTTICDILN